MKKIILLLLISASVFCAYAQSAQKLTEVLSKEEVTYGDASWFIAAQTGLIDDSKSEKEAFGCLKASFSAKALRYSVSALRASVAVF